MGNVDNATKVSKSELIERLGATQMIDGVVTRFITPDEAYELVRTINQLREQNVQLHKAAESLWDGVTGVLAQKDIDRVEQLYKLELTLLLGST